MISMRSPTAFRIFSNGSIAVFLGRGIEWPDFHAIDSVFQQTFGQRVRPIHERVEILERPLALTQVPVGDRADVLRADVAIARAGVVYAKLVPAETAKHLVHWLPTDFAENVPQSDVDRGRGPIFRSRGRLRHRQVDHLLVERLDVQRIAANQSIGQRFVDVRFDSPGAVERFAKTDRAAVGMNTDPQHVRELFGSQCFESSDFHQWSIIRSSNIQYTNSGPALRRPESASPNLRQSRQSCA